jgi:hypothetical protein
MITFERFYKEHSLHVLYFHQMQVMVLLLSLLPRSRQGKSFIYPLIRFPLFSLVTAFSIFTFSLNTLI